MRRTMTLLVVVALGGAACSTGVPADQTRASVATTQPPSTMTSIAPVPTSASSPTTVATTMTTTAAPDTEPPELTVIDPVEGVPVTTRKYEFRGVTEPGATVVAAGRYDVEVNDDGSWSILLVLDRGGNLALFEATDAAGNTSEARMTVVYEPPFSSADYWTGRAVAWERSGIGRWAAVEGESLLWEQNGTSLGGTRTGHVLSITAPTERDPAQPKESFVWVLANDVIADAAYLAVPAGHEVSLDCYPEGGASGDRADLVGIVAVDVGAAQPAQLWQLGGRIDQIRTSGIVCEV